MTQGSAQSFPLMICPDSLLKSVFDGVTISRNRRQAKTAKTAKVAPETAVSAIIMTINSFIMKRYIMASFRRLSSPARYFVM
ncbi:hypothetical protein [Rhizobium rhizosphaerae]|uniref:hypothetical protein n=1 Tax=Xaviernesmea rhizosphaerae TaxID=1672749 RepID=UPI00111BA19A|nr:hypothetical protein [Xaviernesmea rhizosphaerae]